MDKSRLEFLNEKAKNIRNLTIEEIGKFGVGHIGGSSSVVEVLTALYLECASVDPKNPKDPDRDRIVLSKGHAGPALYATMAERGYFPKEVLDTLNRPGTNLPSHCDMNKTIGVDMTAGSLGQGFSAAVGMAIAGKIDRKTYKVFAIVGDGESQEGQIWEAGMLAGSMGLNNLIAFTDYNRMQIDGTTDEICTLNPIQDKWKAFNFKTVVVDGHDVAAIVEAVENAKKSKKKPTMIILNTVKGKGISFCEGKVSSHSVTFSSEEMWRNELEG